MRALACALLALAACGENATPVGEPPSPFAASCVPDLDGTLTAAELPIVLDQPLTFRVGEDVAVDLAGRGSGADRQWDWSADTAGDALRDQLAVALDDQWYAGSFPGGRFVLTVDAATDAVYAADDRGLYLLGLASHDEAPPAGKTLLPYAAPVAAGDRWTETATITGGTLRGLPYNGTDTYAISADARGELHLPYVRFTDALRVRTTVTSTPAVGGASVVVRQSQFFSECFGEIGRATSRPGEPADDFTTAATLRRLAL